MKTKIIMLLVVCSLFAGKVNAQWVVSDPATWRKGLSMRQRTSFRLLRPHRI